MYYWECEASNHDVHNTCTASFPQLPTHSSSRLCSSDFSTCGVFSPSTHDHLHFQHKDLFDIGFNGMKIDEKVKGDSNGDRASTEWRWNAVIVGCTSACCTTVESRRQQLNEP